MIKLKGINITHGKKIMIDSGMAVMDSAVTVITGASGSGKSSILYLLGLISENYDFEYIFNGEKIDLTSDETTSFYRKSKIGYVFQENTLIDSLTVQENIRLAARISGTAITEDQIRDLLAFVELDLNLETYPPNLSGGEKQRLAIACAISKQPELLIADEPTSALDPDNSSMVISVLKRYAQEKGKMVVIATHDPTICEQADYVYRISDLALHLQTSGTDCEACRPQSKKADVSKPYAGHLGLKFYTDYYKQSRRKKRIGKTIMLILCAFAVAFTTVANAIGDGFTQSQEQLLNKISDREIFMVNQTTPSATTLDYDENLSISPQLFDRLKSIEHVKQIYPFFEFRSAGLSAGNLQPYRNTEITVMKDGTEKRVTFNAADKGFVIQPFYPEQSYDKQTECQYRVNNPSKSVYLSSSLAHMLGLSKECKKCEAKVTVGVPVAVVATELQVTGDSKSPSSSSYKYPCDIDASKIASLDFEVAGVLAENVLNSYSSSGNNVIYLPIDTMAGIQKDTQHSVSTSGNQGLLEWHPSSYMLYADKYSDVKPIISKIQTIGSQLKGRSNYQDVDSMNQLVSNVRNTSTLISVILLLIVCILMTVIFSNYIVGRKYETAILRANGLTMKEMMMILNIEALYEIRTIVLSGIFTVLLLSFAINMLASFSLVALNLRTILVFLGISVFTIIIPTLISAVIVNKNKPSKVLRN